MVGLFDGEPLDRLALIGVEHEVERQLRDEAIERHRLDHAVGGKRHPGKQGCDRNRPVAHLRAIGDVVRHLDGGRVRPARAAPRG